MKKTTLIIALMLMLTVVSVSAVTTYVEEGDFEVINDGGLWWQGWAGADTYPYLDDGNWSSYAESQQDWISHALLNFTAPSPGVTGATLRYKANSMDGNLSMPTDCFSSEVIELRFGVADGEPEYQYYNRVYCKNQSDSSWIELFNGGGRYVYEVGIYWEITSCTPSWSCTAYDTCNLELGLRYCMAVQDSNICGESYTGNFSEFSPMQCGGTQQGGGGGSGNAPYTPPIVTPPVQTQAVMVPSIGALTQSQKIILVALAGLIGYALLSPKRR